MCNRADDPTQHDVLRAPEEVVRGIARVNGLSIERARPIADGLTRRDTPTPDLSPCPQCGALGFILPCSECGYTLEDKR